MLMEPIEIIVIIFAVSLILFSLIFNIRRKRSKRLGKDCDNPCNNCPIKDKCNKD